MSLTAILTVVGALATIIGTAGLGGLLKTWLDHKRGKRKQTDEVALALVETLNARVSRLEADGKAEREECDLRITALEATVADLQHDLTSETSSFDAFLLLAETNPEKVIEMVPRIREARRQHKERMALKRGAREGAKMKEIEE